MKFALCLMALGLGTGPAQNPAAQPGPQPTTEPTTEPEPAANTKDDYVLVRPPVRRGYGFFALGGAAAATMIVARSLTLSTCGGWTCGDSGRTLEYIAYGVMVPSFSAGAWRLGRYQAYHDTLSGADAPTNMRARLISGGVMAGVGLAAIATDLALHLRCRRAKAGPYHVPSPLGPEFDSDCKSSIGAAALDLGASTMSAGGALLFHALIYRQDRAVFTRGRVVVNPLASRDRFGMSISGSF